MKTKHNISNDGGSKIRKEFQNKSKKIKRAFAESKTDEELVKNMEKIGFTHFDDEEP